MAALFLIGFMASGKTTVGRQIASNTDRPFIDLDDAIAASSDVPVAELVKRDEPAFRRRETEELKRAIEFGDVVVATGGGCGANPANVELMRAAGTVIALGVDVPEAQRRAEGGPDRPLLASADQLAKSRASAYRMAHAAVSTMGKSIADVVDEVVAIERIVTRAAPLSSGASSSGASSSGASSSGASSSLSTASSSRSSSIASVVALGERSYPVEIVERFAELDVGSHVSDRSRVVVITDTNVSAHWSLPIPDVVEIAPGEASKSFETYARVCNELVARGVDRGSAIVAVGGGVVGDLAGFVAATLFRGIPVVQVPTTIVAMCDAAIGGKTAIDIPAGKNLVGAFHQPRLVACALETLQTLPGRERRAGFGELWKYALLDGPELWRLVASCAGWARDGGDAMPAAFREVMRRSIAYKAEVVGRDERELTGVRALLNLGHTVGHAIESASGMLHGEAVALGLIAAARVSSAVLGTRAELERELIEALNASGLSVDIDRYLTDEVLARIDVDKKRVGKTLKYIAIRDVGDCEPVEIQVTELRRILRSNPSP
ncbi:MAG: 3-dehydroquinate synthase [Kofleriaceae bacterium]